MISAWDSLHFAALELVRSTPIKQRLVAAYRHLAQLPEDHVPAEVRTSFGQVIQSLRGVQPLRGEDAVTASVRKMSTQEADDCAALVVEIFGAMCKVHHTAARPIGVVQLHAVERTDEAFEIPALIASH